MGRVISILLVLILVGQGGRLCNFKFVNSKETIDLTEKKDKDNKNEKEEDKPILSQADGSVTYKAYHSYTFIFIRPFTTSPVIDLQSPPPDLSAHA